MASPATSCMRVRLRPGLLFGQVADHRQLEHLSLVGLDDQNQPDHKPRQTDQWPQHERCPTEERDVADECQTDLKHDPGGRKEEALKGMEGTKALFFNGFRTTKKNP